MWARNGSADRSESLSSISSSLSSSSASSNLLDDAAGTASGLEELIPTDDKHAANLNRWMSVLRRNDQLCDMVILLSGRQIKAHRVVVASMGGIMADLLLSNKKNNQAHPSASDHNATYHSAALNLPSFKIYNTDQCLYLELPTVDADCMEALVNCAYSGRLALHKTKVSTLYNVACMLHFDSVAKVCAAYLCANMSIENCISTRRCANRYNDQLLTNDVDQYIKEHFERVVSESREFSALPHIQVKIISDKDQSITWQLFNEKDMGDKLLQWFQLRVRDMPVHMEFRMEFFTDKPIACYFDDSWLLHDCSDVDDGSSVGSCDLAQEFKRASRKFHNNHHANGASCCTSKAKPFDVHSLATCDCEEIDWKIITIHKTTEVTFTGVFIIKRLMAVVTIEVVSHEYARPRSPCARSNDAHVERRRVPKMSLPRCAGGVAVCNGHIVVAGGYNRSECLKHVESYVTDWKSISPMLVQRSFFNSAVNGDKVYAVGGSDGCNDLSSVEELDWSKNSWKFIAPLPFPRCRMGVVVCQGQIYCIGGDSGGKALSDCLKYNPTTGQWLPIAPLITCRSELACAVYQSRIYAAGGCDDWNKLASVEWYDPSTDEWKETTPLNTARRGCSAAVMDDKLYVVGGTNGVQSLDTVEWLDLKNEANGWKSGPSLNNRRSHVRVVHFKESLYTVGGFDGQMFLNSIEYLSQGSNEWKKYI